MTSLYLEGTHHSCHGPSEQYDDLVKQLRDMGVSVNRERHTKTRSKKIVKNEQTEEYDDGGMIGGEIRVLSFQRELKTLEKEDRIAKKRISEEKRMKVLVGLLEAEREGKEKVLELDEEGQRRKLKSEFRSSIINTQYRYKVRLHGEYQTQKAIYHLEDEQDWILSEGHRELLDNAKFKVMREFQNYERMHAESRERQLMKEVAVDRLLKLDQAQWKDESQKEKQRRQTEEVENMNARLELRRKQKELTFL